MDSKLPTPENNPATATKATTKPTISGNVNPAHVDAALAFMTHLGAFDPSLPGRVDHTKDFYSDLVRRLLTVDSISRGKVTCSFSVAPSVVNGFKGLNGGMVAVVAEKVAVACARTVVAEDKELVTGDVSLSYLSAAPMNSELIVEASLLRSGRNITIVSTEFRIKNTKKLVYTSHTNFFHILPSSKLSPELHNN